MQAESLHNIRNMMSRTALLCLSALLILILPACFTHRKVIVAAATNKDYDLSLDGTTKLAPVAVPERNRSNMTAYTQKKPGYTIVPVYYGTSRKRSEKGYYGYESNTYNTLGIINVSIPDVHVAGEIERPFSDFGGRIYNPLKYIETGRNSLMSEDQFYAALRRAISESGKGETFVFIHGYNNSFSDAARKTAQLFFDMQYSGVPIMYTWPSKAGVASYGWDEQQTESTGNIRLLTEFLVDITKRTNAKSISIVAHSMGNRLLSKALVNFSILHPDVRFNHIVMAAPDVYRDDYKNFEANEMLKVCNDVTLYASSNDFALSISNMVHSGIARLGQSDPDLFIMPPIATVDVSSVNCTDMLGHSCYSATKCVIADIGMLLEGVPVNSMKRSLQMVVTGKQANDRYWKFPVFQK
jgi:esterase/lipase superfamily enzyme